MDRLAVLLCLVAACGGGASTEAAGNPPTDAEVATPVAAGPADPLASVPGDTPYLVAMLEPLPAAGGARLAAELGPVLQRLGALAADLAAVPGDDPVERMRMAVIAELAGGALIAPRGVLYDLRGVPVLRMETTDPAGLGKALERAATRTGAGVSRQPGGPRWLAVNADSALYVAVDGRELVAAQASHALMKPVLPVLRREAPLPAPPLPRARLQQLAADHELSLAAIGYLDLARIGERLRVAPELLAALGFEVDASDACREAVAGALAELPPIVGGVRTLAADRIELVAELELSPALRAALQSQPPVPGIPPRFPGRPLIGFAIAGSDAPAGAPGPWETRIRQLLVSCNPKVSLAMMMSPMNTLRGGALVIHGGKMAGFFPSAIEGYLVLTSRDPEAWLARMRREGLGGGAPRDGGPFVRAPAGKLRGFVSTLQMARRGDSLILAAGKQGRAHAEEALAPTGPAPFLQLAVDLERFRSFGKHLRSDQSPLDRDVSAVVDDSGGGLAGDAGLSEAMDRVIGHVDASIGAGPRGVLARVDLLAPRTPAAATDPPQPPSRAVIECRRLLARCWQSASKAYPLLGVTEKLDEIEDTYLHKFDAMAMAKTCLQLDAKDRGCLLAQPDALAAIPRCQVAIAPPRLFSFPGPDPLDDVHEKMTGGPTLADLAGTWVSASDPGHRWEIRKGGDVVHRTTGWTERGRGAIEGPGLLGIRYRNGTGQTLHFVLAGPDELHITVYSTWNFPLPDESRFLVALPQHHGDNRRWLVRDPRGCWLIEERGLVNRADCSFLDRDGGRWLDVRVHAPCAAGSAGGTCAHELSYAVISGFLAEANLAEARFIRARP